MELMQAMFEAVWQLYSMPITVMGFTFSFFNVFVVFAVIGIIVWFITKVGD